MITISYFDQSHYSLHCNPFFQQRSFLIAIKKKKLNRIERIFFEWKNSKSQSVVQATTFKRFQITFC
eukprot:UN23851